MYSKIYNVKLKRSFVTTSHGNLTSTFKTRHKGSSKRSAHNLAGNINITRSVHNLVGNILINLLKIPKCEDSKKYIDILTYISVGEELGLTLEAVKLNEVKRYRSCKGKKSRTTAGENTIS